MTTPSDPDFERVLREAGEVPGHVVDLDKERARRAPNGVPADVASDARNELHFDVALDDAPQPGGGPVDVPDVLSGAVPGALSGRLPIIPVHLRQWSGIVSTLRYHLMLAAHRAGFHAVRSPWYAAKAAFWSVVGVFRLTGRAMRWWWLDESTGLRQDAANRNDAEMWLKLQREVKATRLWRGIVLAAAAIVALIAVPVAGSLAPWWALTGALVLTVAYLAHAGRPIDQPIVRPAVIAARYRRINSDIVLRAYYAAGLGHPDKPQMQVDFASPMARDATDTGSQVTIDLPYGKTFDDAVKARGVIASGLDVALSQVFISREPTSHRRHVLWVADRDPLAVGAGRTPLLRAAAKGQPTDIWQPAPLGLDERGGKVALPLLWNSMLIGAQPRQGKTFAARLLALYAAMDPFVKLTVFDGGGKPDWRKFSLVADRCGFGLAVTRDGDPAELLLAALREIKADVQDRYERLSALPPEVCPEGKLTREIARDPTYRMPVRLVVLDEIQEYFDLGEISKEIAALLVYLVKVAPAAGVSFIDATQRPSGVGGGAVAQQFISFRDNHQVRFALRTGSWQMSDLVLGSGAYSEGHDSSLLLPTYKGVGILRGASDATPTVRTFLADSGDAEAILLAARKLRERAGTLTGHAAGEITIREVRDVLADVRAMFGGHERGLHWETIAARLAERLPEHYADTNPAAISAQLRDLHVPSVNVNVDKKVLKGCRTNAIDAAINRRKAG